MEKILLDAIGCITFQFDDRFCKCNFSQNISQIIKVKRTSPVKIIIILLWILVIYFKYLGTIIQYNGEIEEDVNHRIQS